MIDDDPHLTNLLAEVLRADDFEVAVTNAPSEYATLISQFGPEIILLDWMMPELNGIEILTALRKDEATRAIPVIMLTTKNMLNEVNRLFTAGADNYICKPFNSAIIGNQIRDTLAKCREKRRGPS
jgi:two-component system phosphate regulon response regulator PhoB